MNLQRRTLLGKLSTLTAAVAVGAGANLALGTTAAFADDWCEVDPPVYLRTATGEIVVVHVTMYALGAQHAPAVERAIITESTSKNRKNPKHTDCVITVLIPNDAFGKGFPVKSVISSLEWAEGVVYHRAAGKSGTAIVHTFTLTVADVKLLEKIAGRGDGVGDKRTRFQSQQDARKSANWKD